MKTKYVVGIDVGGTNIKFGLVSPAGKIIARSNLATALFLSDKNKLIEGVASEILEILSKEQIERRDVLGIGMGLPGLIDTQKGIAKFLPNIPVWKNIQLKKILEKKFKLPVCIDNDVNLMTLGEWKFGAGVGISDMVCITLGTGVGGGLIINNDLYRGPGFTAGEIGHIPLNEDGPKCNCGGLACLERYVGNKYLLEKAQKLFPSQEISLEKVCQLADAGDARAKEFWAQTGEKIGLALVSVVNVLNPKRIIIGGGVSNNHRHLFPAIRETIERRAMNIPAKLVQIKLARLGDNAGIMGANVLVHQVNDAR